MEPADLILQLKDTIASPSAADVFKRIYLDPLLFQAFEEDGAMEKAGASCGSDSTMWTPARIGFSLTDTGLDVDDLCSVPMQPIQAELRQKVSALYQKVLRRQTMIYSLEDAVLLALALRERRRLTESWSGLVKEITHNYADSDFSIDNWATALTIVYWISPDQPALLQELDSFSDHLEGTSYFILLSRILLSTPGSISDDQVSMLVEAAKALSETDRVKALEWLHGYGFEGLTKTISSQLLGESSHQETDPTAKSFVQQVDPLEKLTIYQTLDHLVNQEKVNTYQFDSIVRPAFLAQQEELLSQAQARMEAQKARLLNGEAKIQAWKKVVDLVPSSDLAKAELATAYLENLEKDKAVQIQFGESTHPFVLIVRSWVAFSHGNVIDSELFFDRLIQELGNTNKPEASMIRKIVEIAGKIDLPEKMDILLATMPEDLNTQTQAIRMRARLAADRSDFAKARQFAAASLIFDEEDLPSRRILANSYQKQNQYPEALQEWERILSIGSNPSSSDQLAFASCAIQAGKPDLAITVGKALIEKNPSDGSAYQLLGDASLQTKDVEQAGQYFEKAVALSPELEETWNRLASFHLANGDQNKAIEILNTAIKAVPNAASLNYLLGRQYLEIGSNAEAIPLFQKAYRVDPKNIDYIHTLGESLQNAGQWMDAETLYNQAAKLYPFDQDILFGHAKSLLKLNKKSDALIPMQHLVELSPASSDVYLVFGHLVLDDLIPDFDQIDQEDVETVALLDYSRQILQDASDREPVNSHLRLLLAENLAKMGEEAAAREIFASLTEQIFTLPIDLRWRVSYGLGMTSGRMGEFEVALAALQEAANQNADNYQIHQQLAEAYLRANLGQSALQAAQQALAINPKDADNLIWYAEFCTRSHDLQEALSTLDALIKIQPENIELRIKLGAMQIQVGETEIAKNTFRKLVNDLKLTAKQYQQIAAHLAAQKEYQEATGYLRLGIQEDPQASLSLLMDLVQYEQKLGDLSSALNTLETAIGLDPENQMLLVVKADMLAFGGNIEEAILTLEGVNGNPSVSQNPSASQEQHLAILLRLVYLYRRSGAIQKAMEIAEHFLGEFPGESEATFLLADMAYQSLDLVKAEAVLTEYPVYLDPRSQIADLAMVLKIMICRDLGKSTEAIELFKSRELNSRWYLWKSAIDSLVSNEDQLDLKTISSIQNEISGLSITDVDQLFPARDKHKNNLPEMPAYDPLSSSPLLTSIISEAAVVTGGYDTAHVLFDQLRDRFPYEVGPLFSIAKTYIVQAEDFRLAERLHTRRHSPPADSLSLGAFETFEQMILATERVSDSPIVKAWHDRGMAAFYPTIDNFNAASNRAEFAKSAKFPVGKLALENKVADIMQYLDGKEASLQERVDAASQVLEKAPQDALQILEPVVEQLAIRPTYLVAYAMAASACGNRESALDAMENALSQWQDEPEWHLMAARLCAEGKNATGALYHWKLAADLEPEYFATILEMGKGALQFDDTMQSIQYLRKAAHLDPVNYQPWLFMAQAYHAHGDLNQAIASIERSVTLAPTQSEPLVYSAQLSLEAGQSEEALKKIDSALRMNPRDVSGLILKAKALNASGHTDEALDWISHSLSKVANSLPLLLARSEIIQHKEGQKAYLKSLQEIAQDYPKDPKVLQMYGQALAENGQPADALHITQLALKADPGQLDMHLLAGRLLRSTGQLDQAIDHFSACVQIDPEHVDSYLEMAKTYQERRDYPKAGTLFEKVIEIAPRDYRGYYQLGLLLRDSKDYRGAEAMLRKASELTKEDVNILRQLGAIIALNLVHNPQEASIHS